MKPLLRLTIGLTLSTLVCGAFAGARFGVAGMVLLFPVPMLIAMRCLPGPRAFALVLIAGTVARALGAPSPTTWPSASALVPSLLASVVWLLPLGIDRATTTWLPRAGSWAFPAALVVVDRFFTLPFISADVAAVGQPVLTSSAFALPLVELSRPGLLLCMGVVMSALANLGSVPNNQRIDPFPQPVREKGMLPGAVAAFLLFAAWILLGLGAPAEGALASDGRGIVLVAAVVLLALLVRAAPAWLTHRRPS